MPANSPSYCFHDRREPESPSQAQQDLCVLEIFNKPGIYLDIGCRLPVKHSNTYLLEQRGWGGVCIDKKEFDFSQRSCTYIVEDAMEAICTLDNKEYDYISLDIDCKTNAALDSIIKNKITFKFLTIEHDIYKLPESFQTYQRSVLYENGYKPLFLNIQLNQDPNMVFEDWWYDPKANLPIIKELKKLDVLGSSYRSSNNVLWILQRARERA